MPFCKWQRKSALENNPLPSLLFTWLQRLPLLGCRLQVQQYAKQPTFCFCQGTRLPTTENSQGPIGAVAKHKGSLVSKSQLHVFPSVPQIFCSTSRTCFWTPSSWCRRLFLTGTRMPGQVYLSKQWPLWSTAAFGCCWTTSLWWL